MCLNGQYPQPLREARVGYLLSTPIARGILLLLSTPVNGTFVLSAGRVNSHLRAQIPCCCYKTVHSTLQAAGYPPGGEGRPGLTPSSTAPYHG